jgi:hypothetical protein
VAAPNIGACTCIDCLSAAHVNRSLSRPSRSSRTASCAASRRSVSSLNRSASVCRSFPSYNASKSTYAVAIMMTVASQRISASLHGACLPEPLSRALAFGDCPPAPRRLLLDGPQTPPLGPLCAAMLVCNDVQSASVVTKAWPLTGPFLL